MSNDAPVILQTIGVAGPQLSGGTINPGLYYLTESVPFGGIARYVQETMRVTAVSATEFELEVVQLLGQTDPPTRLVVVDGMLTLQDATSGVFVSDCGPEVTFNYDYETDGTTLTFEETNFRVVYTRQGD